MSMGLGTGIILGLPLSLSLGLEAESFQVIMGTERLGSSTLAFPARNLIRSRGQESLLDRTLFHAR